MSKDTGFGDERVGQGFSYFAWPVILFCLLAGLSLLFFNSIALAEELKLEDLINEALKNSPEILAYESRASASKFRIPQAESLPDPMFMFGYQNEGFKQFTLGKSDDAQLMFSLSQMVPFPGKRSLKGEMATRDAESIAASYSEIRLRTIERIKGLYYDLFLSYKNIDLIRDKTALFSRIEDAALARYSSGMGSQQEVLMSQTEKYMLLEKEEMLKQRIQSTEAMLNTTLGRNAAAPLPRPAELEYAPFARTLEDLLKMHGEHSPLVKSKEKMVAAAEAKVRMAEKEYYPDFTLNAGYFRRGGQFDDMWSLTATVNVPLFYRTKQRQAVHEAQASLSEARYELEGTKLMLSSTIRDNYSMVKTAERLMDLYKDGLIPKTYQDFEAALSGYVTGKTDALTVITRLKSLIDFELLYWGQFVERQKAIARLEAATGITDKP